MQDNLNDEEREDKQIRIKCGVFNFPDKLSDGIYRLVFEIPHFDTFKKKIIVFNNSRTSLQSDIVPLLPTGSWL